MNQPTSRGARPALILSFAILLVLPSFGFMAARFAQPGDGAVVLFEGAPGASPGLRILPVGPAGSGFKPGDAVLAIGSRTVDAWLTDALRGPWAAAGPGETELIYIVLRGGEAQEFEIRPRPVRPLDAIRPNWSSYAYLFYLQIIGLIVFLRRPKLGPAQAFLLLSSAIFGTGSIFFLGLQPSDLLQPRLVAAYIWGTLLLYNLFLGGLLHFSLLFPRRQDILRRRPAILSLVYLGPWILVLALVVSRWDSVSTASARLHMAFQSTGVLTALYFSLALGTLVYGYRNSFSPQERRQMRWLLWAAFLTVVPWLALSVIPDVFGRMAILDAQVVGLLWLSLPTAFAIAILREGLFDIDVLINRTLVYGSLTGVLAGLYFGGVVALEWFFRAVTGSGSQLSVVASTLVIAALFNPLRVRIQVGIDRRFYRSKYDAERTLSLFARLTRDEVDLDRLTDSLLTLMDDALQPAHASLWLQDTAKPSRPGTERT